MGSTSETGVSVIVATYNGATYLEEQLRSILRQELPPEEVLIADDGSQDRTLEIARDCLGSGADVQYRILEGGQHPLGVARNIHRAVRQVRTPFVALSDQDDVWGEHRLEAGVRQLLADESACVSAGRALIIDAGGSPTGATTYSLLSPTRRERSELAGGRHLDVLVRRNLWPGMTFTMRTGFAAGLPPAPPGWLHDYWYAFAASCRGGLRLVDGEHVLYRLHGANQIGMARSTRVQREAARWKWLLGPERSTSTARLDQWAAAAAACPGSVPVDTTARDLVEKKVDFERRRLQRVGVRRRGGLQPTALPPLRCYQQLDPDGAAAFVADVLKSFFTSTPAPT